MENMKAFLVFIFLGNMDKVFCNFSQLKIRGFLREGAGGRSIQGLRVYVEDSGLEFLCLDAEKGNELLALGLSAHINLYNVTVLNTQCLITNQSGLRAAKEEIMIIKKEEDVKVEIGTAEHTPLVVCEVQYRSRKWNCLLCNFLNFESTSVCYSCGRERRSGPVGDERLFKHLRGPPYEHKTWDCPFCFARKNSPFKESCWKCLQDKPTSKAWKKKHRVR